MDIKHKMLCCMLGSKESYHYDRGIHYTTYILQIVLKCCV